MSGLSQTNLHASVVRCTLLLCSLTVCLVVSAQRRPTPRATPSPTMDTAQNSTQNVDPDNADLAITAHVTARELRFDVVPNPRVEFSGQPKRETVWDAARQNLPRPVQPGVTYRDIGIQLVIISVFADIDRIVAEALGEVPRTDDAAPTRDTTAPPSDTPANGTAAPPAARDVQRPAPSPTTSTTPARSPRPHRTGRH